MNIIKACSPPWTIEVLLMFLLTHLLILAKKRLLKMLFTVAFLLASLPIFMLYLNISSLLKNIAAAKRTGLKYVVTRQCCTSFSKGN